MWEKRKMRIFNRKNSELGQAEENNSFYTMPIHRLMSYQVANLQGIGTRAAQEDSFAFVNAMDVTEIKNNGLFAVLADGMGGLQDGKRVSEAAVAVLRADFCEMDRGRDLGKQLRESVYRADDLLHRQFGGNGGTTLVACICYQEKLYFASVGDSYLYLKRANGIYRLNQEQTYRRKLYLEAIEEGKLVPEYAEEDPDASSLSEFLGSGALGEVDGFLRPWNLRNGDTLLLCSDGAGGVLTEREILACLEEKTPELACRRMEWEIRSQERVHQDNYTALIIACKY